MANALDAFREQRAAAGQVYAIVKETCELLRQLQSQVSALTSIQQLKTVLQRKNVAFRKLNGSSPRHDASAMTTYGDSGQRPFANGVWLWFSRLRARLRPVWVTHGGLDRIRANSRCSDPGSNSPNLSSIVLSR